MGRRNISKRRNKVTKRRNKVSKRRNKVSKRRNKVSKRRNKVSKRRNKVTKCKNNQKLLGGAYHACYYKDHPMTGVVNFTSPDGIVHRSTWSKPCNAYYYDNDGWYYYVGAAFLQRNRWSESDAAAYGRTGGLINHTDEKSGEIRYVCPKHVNHYQDKWPVSGIG
jgi:hypothetical protein